MKAKVIKTGEMVDVYHEPQHGQITNIYKESVLVNGRMWSEDELDFCVKISEAPEKIYFSQTEDGRQYFTPAIPFEREFIEYTRTDAFIEKAVKWLDDNAVKYWGTDAVDNGMMIYDFKNAMKL